MDSIYLDNLDGVEEGEGQRDEHQEQGADSEEVGDNARALITHDCNYGVNISSSSGTVLRTMHTPFYMKCGVGRNSSVIIVRGIFFRLLIQTFYIHTTPTIQSYINMPKVKSQCPHIILSSTSDVGVLKRF